MTTTTDTKVAGTLAQLRERVRIGDLIFVKFQAGGRSGDGRPGRHERTSVYVVTNKSAHMVTGTKVSRETGAPVLRRGLEMSTAHPYWQLADVRPGPQTLEEAYAEHDSRS
jgi:hypothetical protein